MGKQKVAFIFGDGIWQADVELELEDIPSMVESMFAFAVRDGFSLTAQFSQKKPEKKKSKPRRSKAKSQTAPKKRGLEPTCH